MAALHAGGTGSLHTATASAPIRTVPAGTVVIGEGELVRSLLMLKSGSVEILRGGTRVAAEGATGNLYGEMALLLGKPASATVRTTVPSEFWELPFEEEFLLANPALSLAISRLLANRLASATRYLADVREQFAAFDDHVGMVDQVIDAMVLRNPRQLERRPSVDDDND